MGCECIDFSVGVRFLIIEFIRILEEILILVQLSASYIW
jgi:hypothetical protein